MNERKAIIREYRPQYLCMGGKEKTWLLDGITSLIGYHRRQTIKVLNKKPLRETLACIGGEPVKLKPENKRRPANRKGKRVYTDTVITSLRMVRTFFWYKCGKILAHLIRQQMNYTARLPAFSIKAEIRGKTHVYKPRHH